MNPTVIKNGKVFELTMCELHEQDDDLEFWLSKTPQERVETLEYMRHMMYGTDSANDRVQRVLETVDRERS